MAEIQDNFVLLCNELDVDSILPFLRQKKLLTTEEYEQVLFSGLSSREKRERLLLLIPRKGNNHYHTFCICLIMSGQKELARRLGINVDNISMEGTDHFPIVLHPPMFTTQHVTPSAGTPQQQTQYSSGSATGGSTPIPIPPPPPLPHPPNHSPAMPPVSQRPHPLSVLIIYAKDSILQNPQVLPAPYQRSPEDYCGEVEQLVDTLSVFSGVQAQDGTTIASFRCAYDGGSGFIPNWLQWFDEELKNADCVLLLCSPQLIASLSQPTGSLQMARGQCNIASLNFYIAQKCFIPVFLNMPRQSEWIPVSLRAADCYELYISSLHHQIGDTSGMDERQFVEAAYRCLASPHLQPLNQLLRVLRREVPASHSQQSLIQIPPIPDPTIPGRSMISEETLANIAPEVTNIWEHLGVKLGVRFSTIQALRGQNPTLQSAVLEMLHTWQREKKEEATRKALKTALFELKYKKVAMKYFRDD